MKTVIYKKRVMLLALITGFLLFFAFTNQAEAKFHTTGTFTSKISFSDIEPSVTIDTIDYFGYNASTSASTTIEVQFSRDKENWYNASGTLGAWDTLNDGDNLGTSDAIDLSALNTTWAGWDNYYYPYYYYKIKMSSEDNEVTPTLYETRTYYTEGTAPTLPIYHSSGTSTSKIYFSDIEPSVTVDTIDYFGYNASTSATTTIEVQFSRDRINWYNASGTLDAWDTLSNGDNLEIGSGAIDLSALNTTWAGWDNYYYPYYYYKIKMSSEDNEVTPTLYEARTYYTEGTAPTLPIYHSSGTFTSTNLLDGIGEEVIQKFGYNASTSATTTIKVQFSQDKVNWYNASGTSDGWDTLENGNKLLEGDAIDLSGLGWTGDTFYYKMKLETSNTYETSVLYEIAFYYSDIPEGRIKGGIRFKGGIKIK